MRRVLPRIWIALALACSTLSCGGASKASLRAPAETRVVAAASKPEPAPLPVPAPSPVEDEAIEVPEDGWHAATQDGRLADDALAQRYPLYGVVFHALAQVFEKPDTSSFVIGLMRRGTTLRASAKVSGHGCDNTWHELWSGGYVCRGRGFALGTTPQTFSPAPLPAALYDAVPYQYAKSIAPSALQYFRIPSASEQTQAKAAYAAIDPEQKAAMTAALLGAGERDATVAPIELPWSQLVRMEMASGFYVSVDGEELDGERAFARTVRGAFVEREALAPVSLPAAAGGPLAAGEDLPLGIVYRGGGKPLQRDPISGELIAGEPLARYARVPLQSTAIHAGKLLTRFGQLVPEAKLRKLERVVRPALVPKSARLIHVHLAEQTLVAYEGERAVYATLVSSGKEGFETPTGLFRIHAKHVSTTMDGLAGEADEVDAYSIEDVPWTLYFDGSYALHAAFWHDKFGNTRSHGCVNLSPVDARWLFEWATPTLPQGFHAVMSTRDNPGTFVLID